MGLESKIDILEFSKNSDLFKELVIECRKGYLESQGKQQASNFSGSNNACEIIRKLFIQLVTTNKNEFTFPIDILNDILKTDSTKTSTRLTTYFKNYGIGDYASTGKNRYKIFKVVGPEGEEKEKTIKRESHYTLYFSKRFIQLLKDKGIGSDFLDYDKLMKDADKSALLLEKIRNTKNTEVYIQQYISENISIDTFIQVEKDFLNMTGSYTKKSNTIVVDNNGSVQQTCTEDIQNTFVPREKVNEEEIKEEVNDLLEDFFDDNKKSGFVPSSRKKSRMYGNGKLRNSK